MTLREYLKSKDISEGKFGETVGISQSAVNRYCLGRVPRPKILARIVAATEGKVQPNDFFKVAA